MLELLIVVGIGAGLFGCAALYQALPWTTAVIVSAWLIVAGLALGVPTGVYYHIRLLKLLRARGRLVPRWWLRPTALHVYLDEDERRTVMPWFFIGGFGFLLTVLGCLLVAAGVLRAG